MTSPFRHEPPRAGRRSRIDRVRLRSELAGRFDRRVTVIRAGAGFGKTSLVAEAVADNAMHAVGIDVWLQCVEADQDAAHLGAGILESLAAPDGPSDVDGLVERIGDAVWSRAPDDVCLILDDVHEAFGGATGSELIRRLVLELPAHGHLLLTTRKALPFPVSRLRVQGELLELDESDLAFDDAELEAFASSRSLELNQLNDAARWPALAELTAEAGFGSTRDFLWEEVLADLDDEHLQRLALVAPFRLLDDELVQRVLGDDVTTEELVADLPLTSEAANGTFQLHALWQPVLEDRIAPDVRAKAMVVGADLLMERAEFRDAADLFIAAEDRAGFSRLLRMVVRQPIMDSDVSQLQYIHARVPDALRQTAPALLLGASVYYGDDEPQVIPQFERACAAAREAGDLTSEAIALWRLTQMSVWAHDYDRWATMLRRIDELSDAGEEIARAMQLLYGGMSAMHAGDSRQAITLLHQMLELDPEVVRITRYLRVGASIELGWPELVSATEPSDEQVNVHIGHAMWLRGEAPPEFALEVATGLADSVMTRGFRHQMVSMLGVLASIAVAAGGAEQAAAMTEQARRVAHAGIQGATDFHVRSAEVAVAFATHDEERGHRLLRSLLHDNPLRPFPSRTYFNMLPLVCLVSPEDAEFLTTIRLGPALQTAIDAGNALVAARAGDPSLAAMLPWQEQNLLRAHVLAPHLTELALAASEGGNADAETVLELIPSLRTELAVIAEGEGPAAAEAKHRLSAVPAKPAYRLDVQVLGALDLFRDDVPVDEADWLRRERVREIFAFVLHHGRVSRNDAATALWPDQPIDKSLANLRVNVRHLQRALQPERSDKDRPWFLTLDDDHLAVASGAVGTDAAQFDALVTRGREADDRSLPREALERHLAATDLYAGDYLAPLAEAEWLVFERIRLRALFVTSATRAGELLLGRGEPEEAMRFSDRANEVDPFAERAHRLRIRSLQATGDRGGPMAAGAYVLALLRGVGLTPEHETDRLLQSIGVDLS